VYGRRPIGPPPLRGYPPPMLPDTHPLSTGLTTDSPLIRAYRGERSERLPVWFMRQAGRSLPEYRAVREGVGMLESCLDPALAAEITLQPVRRHGVDAAILFSDIVVPLKVAGVDVDIVAGTGPVMGRAVTTRADVDALPELDPADLDPIREAVGRCVAELGTTPLIGFAGAPFTIAAYLVEGRPSRDHLRTRALLHAEPDTWHALLGWVARTTITFLRAQVEAGASALQLFDSWAGTLSPPDYRTGALPHSKAVLEAVADLGVPRVHFGTRTSELLQDLRDAGADVVGVDDRIPLAEAIRRLGPDVVVQGNIDPALLSAPWPVLERHVRGVIDAGRQAHSHVVNLGHGVPPDTDPQVLTRVVELVHSEHG
jgi:uroporphyrinogen decarboxylase